VSCPVSWGHPGDALVRTAGAADPALRCELLAARRGRTAEERHPTTSVLAFARAGMRRFREPFTFRTQNLSTRTFRARAVKSASFEKDRSLLGWDEELAKACCDISFHICCHEKSSTALQKESTALVLLGALPQPAVLNFCHAVACCAAAGEWSFGLCATRSREPRQARKGATVPGTPCAPQTTRSSSRRQRQKPSSEDRVRRSA
jgi:hypothetical protein